MRARMLHVVTAALVAAGIATGLFGARARREVPLALGT